MIVSNLYLIREVLRLRAVTVCTIIYKPNFGLTRVPVQSLILPMQIVQLITICNLLTCFVELCKDTLKIAILLLGQSSRTPLATRHCSSDFTIFRSCYTPYSATRTASTRLRCSAFSVAYHCIGQTQEIWFYTCPFPA